MILPGATLGVLGGGQLGRMFTVAARVMGYRVMVLDPHPYSPAGALADVHLQADYRDLEALHRMGEECDAVTIEWENVPAETLETLSARCPVRPSAAAVAIARDRIREKTFMRDQGCATAAFFPVREAAELAPALKRLRLPALLKTATLGYDGKGQVTVQSPQEAVSGFEKLGSVPCVLEEKVTLHQELSVVLARGSQGETAVYPVGENVHRGGILHTTLVPGRVAPPIAEQAIAMARRVADAMDYVGVLAVEFFLTGDGELLINEMAPRPHNSGHYTLDACVTSQFEQQVRALCDLPLGEPRLLSPVAMLNLLGDLWGDSQPPWPGLLAHPAAKLHLYGKREARSGRKMGHCNLLAETPEAALDLAQRIFSDLQTPR